MAWLRMAKKLPDLQVLIPYKDLQQLLSAAGEVESLKSDLKRNGEQLAALRFQFTELMERFHEIQD